MTALVSYSTGTATVSAGGTTVTGGGTIWSGVNARPGDIFQIGNFQTVISDVVDALTLTIPPWGGGAQTGVAYTIWQVSPQRFAGAQAMADVSTLVAALNTSGFFVFVDSTATVPDPSLGNDGQYASQPTTGKTWVKISGAWSYLGIYKAFQLLGTWSGATAYSVGDVVALSGSSYVCVLDHTNHTPPNVTYWQLLASIGNTGNTGATGAGYGGTSTTSLTIAVASKVFTTQAGLAYTNGARVRASSAANTSNWMEGLATYSGTTLTIAVDKINGSGTLADWNLNVVGQPGAGDLSSANNLSDLANAETARANLGILSPPQGRLTLATGVPVMTTTQSAKTTIFYTPCLGNMVPIYDGIKITMTAISELSVATTDTTKSPAAIGASKVNDWFVWNDSGTIRLSHGPDWTNDTTRSAGTALVMVNGIRLNNASITNGPAASRGTYVGTTRSNGSSQLDYIFGTSASGGGAAFFGVWNAYNRRRVETLVQDTAASWTYAVATTWRSADNSVGWRVSYVDGLGEDAVNASYKQSCSPAGSTDSVIGIGLDTTSSFSGRNGINGTTSFLQIEAKYDGLPGAGFHFLQAVEFNSTTTSITFQNTAGTAYIRNGLTADIWN